MAELMSEELRAQLARRLGVAHLVVGDYWGHVPARECGALVREAIRVAEQALAGQAAGGPGAGGPAPWGQAATGLWGRPSWPGATGQPS